LALPPFPPSSFLPSDLIVVRTAPAELGVSEEVAAGRGDAWEPSLDSPGREGERRRWSWGRR
jgi:hypothetical protein